MRTRAKQKLMKMYPKYSKKIFDNVVTSDETQFFFLQKRVF